MVKKRGDLEDEFYPNRGFKTLKNIQAWAYRKVANFDCLIK